MLCANETAIASKLEEWLVVKLIVKNGGLGSMKVVLVVRDGSKMKFVGLV